MVEEITSIFPTPAEIEAQRRQTLAFHTEAARSGLFSAALDIAKTMKEANIPEGEAALLTGAVEFAVQLWDSVMLKAGNTPADSRHAFEKQARALFTKHRRADDPQEASVQ